MESVRPRIAIFLPLFIVYFTSEQLKLFLPFVSEAIMIILAVIMLFVLDRKFFQYPFFKWWLAYSLIVLINLLFGDAYFSNLIYTTSILLFILFSSVLGNYCLNNNLPLAKITIVFFSVTLIYIATCSFVIDLVQPGIIRIATGQGYGGDTSLLTSLYLTGMSNYYLPHALPLLIPTFIMGLRNKQLSKIIKVFLLLSLIACLVLIYISYATTALLLAIILLLLAIFANKADNLKQYVAIIIFVSILFLPLMLNKDFLISFLQQVDIWIGGEGELHAKLLMFQDSIHMGKATGDMEERVDLYNRSTSSLFSNIIWGTNNKIGGHSYVLDNFASLGLLGFVPLVLMLYNQIKYSYLKMPKSAIIYFCLSVFGGVLMITLKSMSNWEMWLILLCIMPLLTYQLAQKQTE